jgi:hypothetical protein
MEVGIITLISTSTHNVFGQLFFSFNKQIEFKMIFDLMKTKGWYELAKELSFSDS